MAHTHARNALHTPHALKRCITGFGALLLTLTALSPSLGVFVVASDVMHQAGSGVFLCFVAVVVLDVAVAALYAELGTAFPHAGGEYTMAGRVLGPAWGFAMLGMIFIGGFIAPALVALGLAGYVAPFLPGVPIPVIAMVSVAAVTVLAVLSIRFNAWVTGAFLATEMLCLACVAWLGFSHAHGNWVGLALHPALPDGAGGLHPAGLATLFVSAAASIYAFNGFGAAVYFAEEMHEARRHVGGVIYGAVAIAALAECVPVLGVIAGAPDFAKIAGSATPIPDFIQAVGGPLVGTLLSLGVGLALFNTNIANVLSSARLAFATARDGGWPGPANAWFGRIHARYGSPWIGTLAIGAGALLLCLVPLNVLVTILGNGNIATYTFLALAVLRGRRTGTTRDGAPAPLHPLAPATVLAAAAAIMWMDLRDPAAGRIGLVITALTLGGGALYYFVGPRRNPAWAFRAPVDEARVEPPLT